MFVKRLSCSFYFSEKLRCFIAVAIVYYKLKLNMYL